MRVIKALVLAGLVAVATGIAQASAASPARTSVRCSLRAQLTAPLAQTGGLAGTVGCGHAFGKGSYRGRYRDDVSHWPTVSETGSGRLTFKAGSIRGTYKLGPALASGTAPYRGTFHITGGTGRLGHVSGTLVMTCTHRIPPLTSCTLSGAVSGPVRPARSSG